jgi:hypothetical protein
MHHNWNFLYFFRVIAASSAHLALPYDPKHPNASRRITTPRLHSPLFASHHIASGHTSHRIHHDDLPSLRTLIRYHQYHQHHRYHHKKSTDLQDLHHGPSRTWPTFRWSTLPPRPGDRKDETLHTGARSCTSKKRDGGQPSTLYAWAGYRPTSESEFRAFMAGQAPAAARTGVMSDLGEGDVRPLCSALLRRSQAEKRLRCSGVGYRDVSTRM